MIIRLEILEFRHSHIHGVHVHHLDAAIFVASREHQVAVVLKSHLVIGNHHRLGDHHLIVGARVLSHNHAQLVVRVGDALATLGGNHQVHLLVMGVVVDVGVGSHLGIDSHCVLTHRESRLEQHIVGVVLTVYLEQIVAALGDNEIIVGNAEVVVEIMHKRRLAGLVVLDVGLVESVNIFALHQLRGLPVGIAVRNAVSQVLYFEVKIIEVYVEHIVAPHHIDGREIHVAHWRYLERLHIRVEDVNLRVLGSYSCHCKKAHYYNISYAFHI